MSLNKLKQLIYESDHWKRSLRFMEESNIQNKDSISRLLKDDLNKASLPEIEAFHTKFLSEDHVIGLLRNDIADLDQLLTKESLEGPSVGDIVTRIRKVRASIAKGEEHCNKLKLEFNRFLTDNIFC